MVKKVFISYRRNESNDVVGRIFEHMARLLGSERVFRDINSVPLGSDFRTVLMDSLRSCGAMVAIIGKGWLDATDDSKNRSLDNENDWVRMELEAALDRGVPVVPVLLGVAALPKPEQLPSSLSQLAYRQGMWVRPDPDFVTDVKRLCDKLRACGIWAEDSSELQRAFRFSIQLDALSHGSVFDLGDPYGVAYMGGCKFRLTLSNAGSSPLTIISMKFASQWQLIDPLTLKRKEIRFAGFAFPISSSFV